MNNSVVFSIFIMLCNHHLCLAPKCFHHPRDIPDRNYSRFLPPPNPWQPLVCFLSLWVCLFQTSPINGIIHYVTFGVWLLSLSIMFSRFIHIVACVIASFLSRLSGIPLCGGTIFCLSIHLLMGIRVVSTFWLLWLALLWTCTYM